MPTRVKRSWSVTLLTAAITLTSLSAHARVPPREHVRWDLTQWTLSEGLPQSSVTGIMKAADGRLWVATFAGLTRFDGEQFEMLSAIIGEAPVRVTAMLRDPLTPNVIWVATEGEGLWRLNDSALPSKLSLEQVTPPPNIPKLTVLNLSSHTGDDPKQGLWLSTDHGPYQITPSGSWLKHKFSPLKGGELDVEQSTTFEVDIGRNGDVWSCAKTPLTVTSLQGESQRLLRPNLSSSASFQELPSCRGALLTLKGDYLIQYEDSLWVVNAQGEWSELKVSVEGDAPRSVKSYWQEKPWRSPRGELWVMSEGTLLSLGDLTQAVEQARRGEPVYAQRFELSHPGRVMYATDEGVLWLGTTGGGLYRISEGGFSQVTWTHEGVGVELGPVTGAGRDVWFVRGCERLWRYQASTHAEPLPNGARHPRSFERLTLPPPPKGGCVKAMGSREGDVLLAREEQLLTFDRQQGAFIELWGKPHLSNLGHISLIEPQGGEPALSSGDRWWVGTRHGELLSLRLGQPPQRVALPSEVLGVKLLSLLELSSTLPPNTPSQGEPDLAIGHALGVTLRRGGVWRTWTYEDGLPRAEARHLFEDKRGVLWVATYGDGLGWIKGDQAGALPSRRGELYDRFLSSITLTKDNSVWLQGNKGVIRARLSDLEAARLNPEHAIVTHHLKTGEANGWLRSSAAFTPDGSLWLAGVDRLSVVETSALITDRPLPSPRIKSLLVGDTTLSAHPLSANEELTPKRLEQAPAEAFRRLEVSYATTTLEYDNGVSYEHRLVPLPQRSLKPDELNALRAEVPWVSAGSAQVAVFPQLHPGAYLFEVRSISLEHTPSPPTQIAFKIPHKWHEHLWVRALLGLALMALTTLLGLWRARLISQHNKQLLAEIKQREVVEAKLGAREAHYRQVFNQAANAFLLYSKQGACVEVNPQASALFGASEEVLLACDPRLLGLPPLEHLAENREGEHTPLLCTRVDGGVFPARMSYVRCHVEGSEMWLVSVMDLSAIVTAHERQTWVQHQLAVARRMDALGRLASGIAHDLNNILGALAGNIELLGEDLPTDDPFVQESLSDVRESVVRGSALSQQLLAFSRLKSSQRPTTLDPIEVVRALEKLLHRLMPQGVTLLFDLKPVGELKLNRGTLEQVLLTLTLHAAEASPPDGEVRVRVGLNSEGALSLLVEDSGPAIPLSALRSVLEGYREGGDIGVPALALVKRVITEAQGSLSVRRYGERNVVIVEWPSAHLTPLPHQNRERTQQAKRPDRSLNLVVVDDNHELRRALVRQLTSLGHAVEGFGDPLEALEALSARPTAPHILISDVIMPGMNGRQLANEVRRRFPQLPVLFISGYTSDVLGEVSMEGENEQLLHKPFTKEVLRRKLNALAEAALGRSSAEHDEATDKGQKAD